MKRKNGMTKHPIDAYVGQQLRIFRNLAGRTQTDLGRHLNVSFQQIQKYEIGSNRVAASRLHEISKFLNVPVSDFFPKDDEINISQSITPEETDLINAYRKASPNVRNAIRSLASSVSEDAA
jgi:transcriptional regulator with XRE-family HTH domain